MKKLKTFLYSTMCALALTAMDTISSRSETACVAMSHVGTNDPGGKLTVIRGIPPRAAPKPFPGLVEDIGQVCTAEQKYFNLGKDSIKTIQYEMSFEGNHNTFRIFEFQGRHILETRIQNAVEIGNDSTKKNYDLVVFEQANSAVKGLPSLMLVDTLGQDNNQKILTYALEHGLKNIPTELTSPYLNYCSEEVLNTYHTMLSQVSKKVNPELYAEYKKYGFDVGAGMKNWSDNSKFSPFIHLNLVKRIIAPDKYGYEKPNNGYGLSISSSFSSDKTKDFGIGGIVDHYLSRSIFLGGVIGLETQTDTKNNDAHHKMYGGMRLGFMADIKTIPNFSLVLYTNTLANGDISFQIGGYVF